MPTIETIQRTALRALIPPPRLRLSEWIEAHVQLPEGVTAQPGPVRLWPFQREIADAIGDPLIERVTLVKPVRVGFTTIPAAMGVAALNFEAAQLVAKIEGNPLMSDGIAVFDVDAHGNARESASTDPGASRVGALGADLGAARTAMRRKTGLDGGPIDVAPRFVLVPPELETDMQRALAEIQATTADDFNPFAGLSLVVEPRLTSPSRWYVVADPATVDGLEYAYLEGAPGPQIFTRAGFEVDGTEIKVRLDFGCGWVDHRGWYRVG